MTMDALMDPALGALGLRDGSVADSILEFREAALSRTNAGRCMHCYFEILDGVREEEPGALSVLRAWMERHVVIVVSDDRARELERLPVHLDAKDLEGFCHRVLTTMLLDRAYENTSFEFRFEYAVPPAE